MDTCMCVAESLHCSAEAVTVLFLVGYLSIVALLSHVRFLVGYLSTVEVLSQVRFLVGYLIIVELLTHVLLFAIPWTAARRASLSFTVSQRFLKLVSIELMMPSNHLFFYFFYDLLVIQKCVI